MIPAALLAATLAAPCTCPAQGSTPVTLASVPIGATIETWRPTVLAAGQWCLSGSTMEWERICYDCRGRVVAIGICPPQRDPNPPCPLKLVIEVAALHPINPEVRWVKVRQDPVRGWVFGHPCAEQIPARPAAIFSNGFESGDLSAWSRRVP